MAAVDTEMFEEMVNGVDVGGGLESGNVVDGIDPAELAALEEDEDIIDNNKLSKRVIKRAKRPSKNIQFVIKAESEAAGDGTVKSAVHLPLPYSKNSRKSRDGKGRGLPKKGGAGGKGTWGKPGSELDADRVVDEHDPNYDSDREDKNVELQKIDLERSDDELQNIIEPVLLEYFEHGMVDDVMECLYEMNLGKQGYKAITILVNMAMEHKAHHREFSSVLISDLYGNLLQEKEIERAFDELLDLLPELTIDVPEAPVMVGQFIARAVADDCIPPVFVNSHEGRVDNTHAKTALEKADVLLHMKHGMVRLDNVWGTGGGNRPVKALIKKMVLLLKEYLSSGDITEATRCLQELEVPHFNHELVYEAINMALEYSSERAAEMISKLMKSLSLAIIITKDQFEKGVTRIYDDMPDICLDVPNAYIVLERFVMLGYSDGYISKKVYDNAPSRGRKRFVSEGDGGRLKESEVPK